MTKRSKAQNTNLVLDWEPHSVRWAGFGSVLLRHSFMVFLNLTIAIHPLDNSRLKSHTVYVYRNSCMITLRCSKMANTYHDIGSRIKHRRTGIDDQTSDHDRNTHTHDRATFSQGLTPRLRKSLVNFEIQSFFLLKFETRAFGLPKT